MKQIIISERQAYKLGLINENSDGDSMFLDGSDETAYMGANAATSPNGTIVTTRDGDEAFQGQDPYASPMTTQKQADQQTVQNGWASRRR